MKIGSPSDDSRNAESESKMRLPITVEFVLVVVIETFGELSAPSFVLTLPIGSVCDASSTFTRKTPLGETLPDHVTSRLAVVSIPFVPIGRVQICVSTSFEPVPLDAVTAFVND